MTRFISHSALLVALIASVAGCGGSSGTGGVETGEVSGKVTLAGKAVSGTVVFVASDGIEHYGHLAPDGTYKAEGVPTGPAKVMVKKSDLPPPPPLPRGVKPPDAGGAPPLPTFGVPPPAKYANPKNGLTLTVKGGQQTFDIDLK